MSIHTKWNMDPHGSVKPYPVMIFIHGESYSTGTGNSYDGSVLASFGNVLVVTMNYRLGVLGFLSTADSHASGNYALWDIIAGIHWVKENIRTFRGNPNRITLFGQGHGAALVNILLVSPMSRGNLFQGAILQSGTALSSWAAAYKPERCVSRLAQYAKCTGPLARNHSVLVACLKNTSLATLLNFDPEPPKYRSCFSPVHFSKNGVLPKPVRELHELSVSRFIRHPVLIGVTKYDALSSVKKVDLLRKIEERHRERVMRTFVNNIFDFNRQSIYSELEYKYTDWGNLYEKRSNTETIISMVSDVLYVVPAIDVARYHSMVGQTYFFAFGVDNVGIESNETLGSFHGDDLAYVFGEPVVPGISSYKQNFFDRDKHLSKIAMTYWSNFAKSGDPNRPKTYKEVTRGGRHYVSMQWPKYNEHSGAFLHLGDTSKIGYHYRNSKVAFWIRRIRQVIREANTTEKNANLLDFSYNLTIFDEPQSLINYDYLVTLEPPSTIPPSTTVGLNIGNSRKSVNSGAHSVSSNIHGEVLDVDSSGTKLSGKDESVIKGVNSSTELQSKSVKSSAISLNITIAIGCSLLFLNTLAFIGIYHQKKKIKELYRTNPRSLRSEDSDTKTRHSRTEIESASLLEPPRESRNQDGGNCVIVVKGHKSDRRSVRISDSPKMTQKYPITTCDELASERQIPARDIYRPMRSDQYRNSVSTFRISTA